MGLLILKKPSPKAKLETERVQNLAQYVKENEKQIHYTQTAIGLFFLLFFKQKDSSGRNQFEIMFLVQIIRKNNNKSNNTQTVE